MFKVLTWNSYTKNYNFGYLSTDYRLKGNNKDERVKIRLLPNKEGKRSRTMTMVTTSEHDSLMVSALACHAADPGSNPDFFN